MINNLGVARPLQSGLQDAMIIYEMIVEGGLTRYMAVSPRPKYRKNWFYKKCKTLFLRLCS